MPCLHARTCRYFRSHLKDVQPQQDVTINVHCDLGVFSQLLAFSKLEHDAQAGWANKHLHPGNAVPILIASNFLGVRCLAAAKFQRVMGHAYISQSLHKTNKTCCRWRS